MGRRNTIRVLFRFSEEVSTTQYLIMLTEDVVIARQFQTQFLLLKRNFVKKKKFYGDTFVKMPPCTQGLFYPLIRK